MEGFLKKLAYRYYLSCGGKNEIEEAQKEASQSKRELEALKKTDYFNTIFIAESQIMRLKNEVRDLHLVKAALEEKLAIIENSDPQTSLKEAKHLNWDLNKKVHNLQDSLEWRKRELEDSDSSWRAKLALKNIELDELQAEVNELKSQLVASQQKATKSKSRASRTRSKEIAA